MKYNPFFKKLPLSKESYTVNFNKDFQIFEIPNLNERYCDIPLNISLSKESISKLKNLFNYEYFYNLSDFYYLEKLKNQPLFKDIDLKDSIGALQNFNGGDEILYYEDCNSKGHIVLHFKCSYYDSLTNSIYIDKSIDIVSNSLKLHNHNSKDFELLNSQYYKVAMLLKHIYSHTVWNYINKIAKLLNLTDTDFKFEEKFSLNFCNVLVNNGNEMLLNVFEIPPKEIANTYSDEFVIKVKNETNYFIEIPSRLSIYLDGSTQSLKETIEELSAFSVQKLYKILYRIKK